uniref:Uncharacterized protein n=1 Tax=Phasianus colchicus TaxID=9054 RepID=A0A669QPC6_PHACC
RSALLPEYLWLPLVLSSAVCMIAHITAVKMPTLHRHAEEKFFVSAEGRKEPVPSIHDPPTKELSVVVPSYNEEDRSCCYCDNAEVTFCW